jgi:hypothetical protein
MLTKEKLLFHQLDPKCIVFKKIPGLNKYKKALYFKTFGFSFCPKVNVLVIKYIKYPFNAENKNVIILSVL